MSKKVKIWDFSLFRNPDPVFGDINPKDSVISSNGKSVFH